MNHSVQLQKVKKYGWVYDYLQFQHVFAQCREVLRDLTTQQRILLQRIPRDDAIQLFRIKLIDLDICKYIYELG